MLLLPTTTYRAKAFIDAALKMGIDIVAASERPSTLERKNPSGLLTLDFGNPELAARQASQFAEKFKIDAVIPVDEDTAIVAASVARSLGLKHNSLASVQAAKNKLFMREMLSKAYVRIPRFWHSSLDGDIGGFARRVNYPCVVKPVFLSTSRGVMRVDDEREFAAAIERLERILALKDVARRGGQAAREVLVEEFVPGREVAVEGLLTEGELRVLAIFDKPDPLDGPFFEETIYVTPSRLPDSLQSEITRTTSAATHAMGLERGPIHAELRVNEQGAWVIEVAARAIGGLCSRALRFGQDDSLEEVILRHAIGQDVSGVERESRAAGVMMIPIPRAGILTRITGLDEAKALPHIDDVVITAHLTQELMPPPEGSAYLGFIFSHANSAEEVEEALRRAHGRLEFAID